MTVTMSKGEVWYRQMSYPGVEFRFTGRMGPGQPHRLVVRSIATPSMQETFEVEDPNAAKDMYLGAAQSKFLVEMTERARKAREHRRAQPITDLRPLDGHQVQEGAEREPDRPQEGGAVENDAAAKPDVASPPRKGSKRTQAGRKEG